MNIWYCITHNGKSLCCVFSVIGKISDFHEQWVCIKFCFKLSYWGLQDVEDSFRGSGYRVYANSQVVSMFQMGMRCHLMTTSVLANNQSAWHSTTPRKFTKPSTKIITDPLTISVWLSGLVVEPTKKWLMIWTYSRPWIVNASIPECGLEAELTWNLLRGERAGCDRP